MNKKLIAIKKDERAETPVKSFVEQKKEKPFINTNNPENRYQMLVEHLPSGVAVYQAIDDGENFLFIEFNRACEKIENIKAKNLIGNKVTNIFPGIKEMGLLDVFKRVYKTGITEKVPIAKYKDDRVTGYRENFVYKLPSGEIVSVYSDKTEEIQKQEALKASEIRFRELIDFLPQPIFEVDLLGNPTFFNQTGLEVFGYTQDEVIKMSATDFFILEDTKKILKNIKKELAGIRVGEIEYTAKRKDGSTFPVSIKVNVIKNNGDNLGLRGIMVDLTQRKQTEEYMRRTDKAETISTLTGGIAHDFNNFLSMILGYAELLLNEFETSSASAKKLQNIIEAAHQASSVVHKLVSYTKPNELKDVNINNIIEKSIDILPGKILKPINVKTYLINADAVIKADHNSIIQVFINLILNAAHAMQNTALPTLQITTNIINDPIEELGYYTNNLQGNYLLCKVQDNGIGIKKENLEKIFTPYFTTKSSSGGTGLGLHVVNKIVKEYGGHIKVKSHPGIGTTFFIYFPLETSPPFISKDELVEKGIERRGTEPDRRGSLIADRRQSERRGTQPDRRAPL